MEITRTDDIYVLAHGFPSGTEMAKHVKHVIHTCSKYGIQGVPSKMGTHMTLLPPFYGNEESIRFASAILKVMTALIGEMDITISGVGIFPPTTANSLIESLHFKIELPDTYHSRVEQLKTMQMFKWVYRPLQTSAVEPLYIPHVHVIEGEALLERTHACLEEIEFMITGKKFVLPPPQFFKKDRITKEWTQVVT